MVSDTASFAAIVRIDVVLLATVDGFAVIVTVGTFKVPLPVNRAQPDRSAANPSEVQQRRVRMILLYKGAVAKVLSLIQLQFGLGALVIGNWRIIRFLKSF